MIFKLHKIPDRFIFRLIFLVIILWNLKYLFLIVQVPFTMMFIDYTGKNQFYSQITQIQNAINRIKDFQDEGESGFISDIAQNNVFDYESSIKNFYITQYSIVPSILKNDTQEAYVIGVYEKIPEKITTPDNYKFFKKINDKTYIFKRIEY